ncbi:MAG: hypothetical protein ABSB59_36160 [Streptosporangiaceae bacterium]
MPRSGTPEKSPAFPAAAAAGRDEGIASRPGPRGRRMLTVLAAVLAVALIFVAYLRMSRTYPENSDESNDLLMAWDMLHGNALLHGWYLSDVSFITTELPQYMVLVGLFGLHTDTAHIAAAMTYTLVLVLSVLLAGGSRREVAAGEGRARMLLTAGLVFAPQLGVGVFIVLLSLGHVGTSVPLLLTWLALDRFPARWYTVAAVGLLLAWVLVADPLVLLVGVVPLVAVCALRVARALARRQDTPAPAILRSSWYELSLAVAAIAAQGVASLAGRLLQAYLHPVPYRLAPLHTWPKHAYVTAKGLLALFGAKPEGPPAALAFALLHLAGVALVAWAVWRVARHYLSWPDMISQILLLAMVVNVAAYVPSTLANATDLNAREFAVVLPYGAVLAGRTLAPGLRDRWLAAGARGRRRTVPAVVAGVLLAGYGASLGWAAAQPSVPAMNARLVTFLQAHHLTSGIGGYWESSVATVGSGGAVTIRAVLPGTLAPDLWEAKSAWYDPGAHQANFLVASSTPGFFNHWQPNSAALAALGKPVRIYRTGPYTVYVYDQNLLAELPRP